MGMITELLKATEYERAAEILKNGGIVAMPTETVYGLAANTFDASAVAKIFVAKGRPQDNPLIVHICELTQLSELCDDIPDTAYTLAKRFWPGPLTIILNKKPCVPYQVTAGLDTVAVRFPSHPVASALIKACGFPLAAPSANISGSPSPTTSEHVIRDLCGKIDAVLEGGTSAVGVESTVISLAGDQPRLLRPGGITLEQLQATVGTVIVDKAVTGKIADTEKVSSPGMKYRHYAPKSPVKAVCGRGIDTAKYINACANDGDCVICYAGSQITAVNRIVYGSESDKASLAHGLFAALREADARNPEKIYIQCPTSEGIGLAVANRIKKAAGFDVIYTDGES